MGWIKQTQKPCDHEQRPTLPDKVNGLNYHMLGDIWQCDDCEAQFVVDEYTAKEGMQWDLYDVRKFKWTRLL